MKVHPSPYPCFSVSAPQHWLSATRQCMCTVFLGWSEASTSFLSVSIRWLPKECSRISHGLSISPVYILEHAECALLHKMTWGHWMQPDRVTELALSLFSARTCRLMSVAVETLCHVSLWMNHEPFGSLLTLAPFFHFINLLLSYEQMRLFFNQMFSLHKGCSEDNLTWFYY